MTIEESLKKDGYLFYKNKGVSMLPLLRQDRDIMLIKTITKPIKKYDSVLFIRPNVVGRGHYVMHRVLKINNNDTYFIIGDNTIKGETVKKENIIGILEEVKRGNKTIDCNNKTYLLFVKLWWFIYPIRLIYMILRTIIFKIKRRLNKQH